MRELNREELISGLNSSCIVVIVMDCDYLRYECYPRSLVPPASLPSGPAIGCCCKPSGLCCSWPQPTCPPSPASAPPSRTPRPPSCWYPGVAVPGLQPRLVASPVHGLAGGSSWREGGFHHPGGQLCHLVQPYPVFHVTQRKWSINLVENN